MTSPEPATSGELSTASADYGELYYRDGLGLPYDDSEPHWARFFGAVASAVVGATGARSALDAGCAKGFLVRAMLDQGVDAYGVDVSEYAISEAVPEVQGRVQVHDLTTDLDRSYDLITCIEVLEHMAPPDTEKAVDNICAHAGFVLLSSTPHDFVEPTHVNVKTVPDWVAMFARRGFYRRTGVDLSALSPWAILFERREMTTVDVARMYEVELAPMREEVVVKSQALLDLQRRLDDALTGLPVTPGGPGQVDRILGLVDQVIGLQAELAQERYEAEVAGQRQGATEPPEWEARGTRAALQTELARERELRQALERRVTDAETQAAGAARLQRSLVVRGSRRALRAARAVRARAERSSR